MMMGTPIRPAQVTTILCWLDLEMTRFMRAGDDTLMVVRERRRLVTKVLWRPKINLYDRWDAFGTRAELRGP